MNIGDKIKLKIGTGIITHIFFSHGGLWVKIKFANKKQIYSRICNLA